MINVKRGYVAQRGINRLRAFAESGLNVGLGISALYILLFFWLPVLNAKPTRHAFLDALVIVKFAR